MSNTGSLTRESLTKEAEKAISEECSTLNEVVTSLEVQRKQSEEKRHSENARARELTSAIVATRRVEDKALLASDEAVAHGIKDKKGAEIAVLDRMLKQPYFARIILEEETPKGPKQFEYKMGFSENSECRIVDWRKAPIAKLYYEYKEGDDYSEQILDRERNGRIAMRNLVDIKESELKKLSCRYGTFENEAGEWRQKNTQMRSRSTASPSDASSQGFHLPQIASLLSSEQYDLIARSSDAAMLIQGVAGSGKTTVALHRLAWLLNGESKLSNGETIVPESCLILVRTPQLKLYLEKTLPEMGVAPVRTLTFSEWLTECVAFIAPQLVRANGDKKNLAHASTPPPTSIERLKRSMALLKALEQKCLRANQNQKSLFETLIELLQYPEQILEHDETKLLDKSIIQDAFRRAQENHAQNTIDASDAALLLRISELTTKSVCIGANRAGLYQHIVVDEVQDFGPVDLACVFGAVVDTRGITLVGDTAQRLDTENQFPGWDSLRKHWAFKESIPRFVSLNLSHRSTGPILQLADYVSNRGGNKRKSEGRSGRVPIWFKCATERQAFQSVVDWLQKASERYPTSLTAVICRHPHDAKSVLNFLKPTFHMRLRLGDEQMFSFTEGIVITSIEQSKGLEFTNVLLWNPSKKDFPNDEQHRNLLYTAITRAEENLCMVTWGKSSDLLPEVRSALVRGHVLTLEDELEGNE